MQSVKGLTRTLLIALLAAGLGHRIADWLRIGTGDVPGRLLRILLVAVCYGLMLYAVARLRTVRRRPGQGVQTRESEAGETPVAAGSGVAGIVAFGLAYTAADALGWPDDGPGTAARWLLGGILCALALYGGAWLRRAGNDRRRLAGG